MSSASSELVNQPKPEALGSDDSSETHEENGKTDNQQANAVGYPSLPPLQGTDTTKPTPDRDGDQPMPDASVKGTNEDSGAKTGAKSSNKKGGRKYIKEQRDEVNRVLKCKEMQYYQILELPRDTPDLNIRKAYLRISTLIHPDKNADKDTTTAFQRVQAAYHVLGDPVRKREYDAARRTNQAEANNNQDGTFDEEFGPNAWGSDSESNDASDGEDNYDDTEQVPDDFRIKVFEKATPHVNMVLAKHKDSSSLAEIDQLNQRIKEKNEEDGLPNKESFLIRTSVLVAIGLEMSHVKSRLQENPNDEAAFHKLVSLDKQLKTLCRANHYPESWRLKVPDGWHERVEEYEAPEGGGKGKGKEEGKAPSVARSEWRSGAESGPSNKSPKATGSSGKGAPYSKSDKVAKKPDWEPGMTTDGGKILGHRPFYRTDRKTGVESMFGVQFVVEQRGSDNPIILLSGTEVGHHATDAYFELPESEQKDIRFSDRKYSYKDAVNFEELLGFATKTMECLTISEPTTRYPGYGLVKFKSGETDLLSRTALRKMLGKKDADDEIALFFPRPSHLIEPGQAKGQLMSGSHGSGKIDGRAFEKALDSEELFIPEQKSRKRQGLKAREGQVEAQPENSDLMAAIMAQLARLEQKVSQLSG
ncbi:hypothetical protein LTR93_011392 [Exophiala xenobiotica]|nr:hypothetical protein LTR93_011392 [Exophiala xenobiotica]